MLYIQNRRESVEFATCGLRNSDGADQEFTKGLLSRRAEHNSANAEEARAAAEHGSDYDVEFRQGFFPWTTPVPCLSTADFRTN